jgi:hypothetical protein
MTLKGRIFNYLTMPNFKESTLQNFSNSGFAAESPEEATFEGTSLLRR